MTKEMQGYDKFFIFALTGTVLQAKQAAQDLAIERGVPYVVKPDTYCGSDGWSIEPK